MDPTARQSRRGFLSMLGMAGPAAAYAAQRAAERKPNIIYIMADDLGYADPGCYGGREIATPNIDRLAAEGLRFSQCYAGGPVCAPSRCTLMTGKHLGHCTVRANFSARTGGRVSLHAEDVTVAQVLKKANYATGIFGKWGIGEDGTMGTPEHHGFDSWLGFLNQDHALDYFTDYLFRNGKKEILPGNLNGGKHQYVQEVFTQAALRFIEDHKSGPFFLYLPYTTPHPEYMIPDTSPYSAKPWTETEKKYAAMVTSLDRDVGRIMELLKRTGLEKDTLVFFTSDNGAGFREGEEVFKSAGSFRGSKGELYEGGLRVPMIARWPRRIAPGRTSSQAWAFWDFLPTAAALSGAEVPPGIDGISMAPTLLGQKQSLQQRFFYWEGYKKKGFQQAIRIRDWKGVRNGIDAPLELYDLAADTSETRNVADTQPQIIRQMEAILKTARTPNDEYPTTGGKDQGS